MKIHRSSKEYLRVKVRSNIELIAQPVHISLPKRNAQPTVWMAATWLGDPGTRRTARVLVDPTTAGMAVGVYDIYARVTDAIEVPVKVAGQLTVT